MKSLILIVFLLISPHLIFSQPIYDGPYYIKGQVVDDLGKPVAKTRVRASLPYSIAAISHSDDNGRFMIGVPRVGTYTLTVVNFDLGSPSTYDTFYHPDEKIRPTVVVEAERATRAITITLPVRFASIAGVLLDVRSNTLVTAATIRMCRLVEPNYCTTSRVRDKAGEFSIAAINGPFSIEVGAVGYDDWFMILRGGLRAGSIRQLDVNLEREDKTADLSSERLPAPEIVFPTDGANLFGFPRITRLQWSPVPGAATYSVEVEGCQGIRKEKGCFNSFPLTMPRYAPMSGIKSTNYEFEYIGNQPGRYRVWAVDADGKPGKKTQWITFDYPSSF